MQQGIATTISWTDTIFCFRALAASCMRKYLKSALKPIYMLGGVVSVSTAPVCRGVPCLYPLYSTYQVSIAGR